MSKSCWVVERTAKHSILTLHWFCIDLLTGYFSSELFADGTKSKPPQLRRRRIWGATQLSEAAHDSKGGLAEHSALCRTCRLFHSSKSCCVMLCVCVNCWLTKNNMHICIIASTSNFQTSSDLPSRSIWHKSRVACLVSIWFSFWALHCHNLPDKRHLPVSQQLGQSIINLDCCMATFKNELWHLLKRGTNSCSCIKIRKVDPFNGVPEHVRIAWHICIEGSTRVQDISRQYMYTAYLYSRFDPFHVINVTSDRITSENRPSSQMSEILSR